MYSGTTFRNKSGHMLGVHQRIDKIVRRNLASHLERRSSFPGIRQILHFEGKNGPDAIKRKSPGRDEPWHYIDPNDPGDDKLISLIDDHIYNLTQALLGDNPERAAFEAAWLAHAIVDGLTPAHHYPLERKLASLRGGEGLETRNTKRKKIVLPGKTRRQQVKNNWEFWGARGVMTTHLGFEWGVAATIAGRWFEAVDISDEMKQRVLQHGFAATFREHLLAVADLKMYEEYGMTGWSRHLAREVQETLMPEIIQAVMLAWWYAEQKAKRL